MRMRLEIEDITERHWEVINKALNAVGRYQFKEGEPRVCLIVEGNDETDVKHGHLSIERLRAMLMPLSMADAMAQFDQHQQADQDDANTRPGGADQ